MELLKRSQAPDRRANRTANPHPGDKNGKIQPDKGLLRVFTGSPFYNTSAVYLKIILKFITISYYRNGEYTRGMFRLKVIRF
jgi:hypothetical protein